MAVLASEQRHTLVRNESAARSVDGPSRSSEPGPKPRRRHFWSVEEPAQHLGESLRLLVMQVVPASCEHRDLDTIDQLSQRSGVLGGDHTVALSPDDGDGRKCGDLVCPL